MKLVRYGPRGRERPGLIDPQGELRALSGHVADIGWAELSAAGISRLAAVDAAALPLVPGRPVVFMKATTCINGPFDPIVMLPGSRETDWEVELGIVIGRETRRVSAARALDHVAGYCIVHDVSEREYQLEHGGQWDKGKGCDTYGPLGPWLVSRDE